jgi:hypothetical protein
MTLAAFLFLTGVQESCGEDLYFGGFNGTWEGAIPTRAIDQKTFDFKGEPLNWRYRLIINGTTVHVFYKSENKSGWSEVKPNKFQAAIHKTNAIVYAIDSAGDVMDKTGSGGWVETWNFTLTHRDKDTLYVLFTRAVNNYLEPLTKDNARFIYAGAGQFSPVR